ncbi:hypothetical protein L3Y34_017060 [Caenorhabditis briggsae]|uniref:Uncharacterized protein n=1 Tax=Caenorhabditis briggsae TaxID=6238 RepID=A0AAE9DHQ3_CAEBR|nr:hypothetical protein L3Y34_017060 [Caenorhabditis briggsae]
MNPNSPNAEIPSECVLLSTLDYVLFDLTAKMLPSISTFKAPTVYVTDNGEDLISKLFEHANFPLIRMYGSPKELTGNPKIFRSCPGSGVYADTHAYLLYPYYTSPSIYRSLKGEKYICKSDAYVILQKLTLEVYQFEFIRYPILRAKDKAVPIQGPLNNMRFCVLAVDEKPILSHAQPFAYDENGIPHDTATDFQSSKSSFTARKDVTEFMVGNLAILEKELADLKISHLKMLEENQEKSLEIGELQQKNFRLSVKNETDDVQMKQLTDKLAKSELSVDYGTVGTSKISPQKIRCLICEKSIESGEDQIIRCHCVPRIRKIPFEVCNHFAQRAQRLSGLQWRHPEVLKPRIRIVSFCYKLFKMCC